jgi:hypothetical protein
MMHTACDPQVLALVLLAGDGGMRRGEIIGLDLADVDFRGGRFTPRRSVYWKARSLRGRGEGPRCEARPLHAASPRCTEGMPSPSREPRPLHGRRSRAHPQAREALGDARRASRGAPRDGTYPVSVLDIHGTADPLVSYSVQAPSLATFYAADGCSATNSPASIPASGGDTTCVTYDGCPASPRIEVTGCTIQGGGHAGSAVRTVGPEVAPWVTHSSATTARS